MSSPAAPFDRSTEDIGNIVEFGHVNIRVPDQPLALAFYVMGLGLTRDPYLVTGLENAWINVGSSQFHLPVGPAQVLRGCVGLVLPDLDAVARRLAALRPYLEGSAFTLERQAEHLDLHCPWGNRIRAHAPDAARFGHLTLGMPYVEIDCRRGTAARIARFYEEVLAAPAQVGEDSSGRTTRIPIGCSESLVFRETARELPAYDGHHLQISVANFSGVHRKLLARGLITDESNQSQYRFENIVDVDSGEVLATIEHEVRSMRHPMFGRTLVNRDASITANHYAAGHEAARWAMPPT